MTPRAHAQLVRLALIFALVAGVAGLVASLVWVLGTMATRPLDYVEGEVLFDASRIRDGLPLYVDPAVGASYPGSLVPSRYYVLYIPVWPAVLSLVPAPSAMLVARLTSTVAWFGTLARAVLVAPRERRALVALIACAFGGALVLAVHGSSGRPDSVAVAISGAALLRSVRRGRVDALAGVLFALAFFVKPNAIGAAPGALLASMWLVRPRILAPLAGFVATIVALGALVTVLTGGTVWIRHLLASTAPKMMLDLWKHHVSARAPFFLFPLAGSIAYGALAWRRTASPGAHVATCALATSTVWCLLCLAKLGSASNYYLEPGVVAATLLATVENPLRRGAIVLGALVAATVQSLWIGVASVRSSFEELPLARARATLVAQARTTCGAPPGSLVAADEPGLELALDGRLLQTPLQTAHLVQQGRLDMASWQRDLAQPEIACLLVSSDLLERPQVDPSNDRFPVEIQRVLRARFALVTASSGFHLYRARTGDP